MKDEIIEKIDELSKDYKLNDLKKNSQTISERYKNIDVSNKAILNNEEAIAYSLSRMPATMAANEFVINDFINLTDFKPKTILDVGAGTGASSLVIKDYFNTNLTLLEKEESMLFVAKKLVYDATFLKGDIISYKKDQKFDLVVASYVLNELDISRREIALNNFITCTNEYLIIIDAGTPKNHKQMMEIRDYIISRGLYLIAPCPHMEKCPLIDSNDWCHFSVRVNRTIMHRQLKSGTLSYEDEKFTYLIFGKNKGSIGEYKRVIRHPNYRPKVVELKTCTKEGIQTLTITKSNKIYKKARDLKCGDII